MKSIKKERVVYDIVYMATDGTEFTTEEECKKYEQSALCVLLSKYKPLVITTVNEYELLSYGNEDCVVDVVKITTQEDVDLVKQLRYLINPYLCNEEENERYAQWNKEANYKIETALKGNGILFIGRGAEYDGCDCFYIIGSAESIAEKLHSFADAPEEIIYSE